MNANQWREECVYISETVTSALAGSDPLSSFNGDPAALVRYCEMQRDTATREGFHDSAQYIDHCIDDMLAHGWRA